MPPALATATIVLGVSMCMRPGLAGPGCPAPGGLGLLQLDASRVRKTHEGDDPGLVQPDTSSSGLALLARTELDIEKRLVAAEAHFAGGAGEMERSLVDAERQFVGDVQHTEAHHNIGGDRMRPGGHNYAPVYARHISRLLKSGAHPTIVETGILTGTGLAMWSSVFPGSDIYGFDWNTTTYEGSLEGLRSRGFDNSHVSVHSMDQTKDNSEVLASVFGQEVHPDVIIDDGLHNVDASERTYWALQPFLAAEFVYFVEDLRSAERDSSDASSSASWKAFASRMAEQCVTCELAIECPKGHEDYACMAVISRLAP